MQNSGKSSTNNLFSFLLLITLLFAASCSDSNTANSSADVSNGNRANTNAESSAIAKDNATELATLVTLPIIPEEKNEEHADWREDETADPKGKKLTAVLKYNAENTAKIIALAEKHTPPTPIEIGAEEWFPEELSAQSQLSGNESLKGAVYGANDFYNAPYEHGRLIRIQETNYFILELTTY